MTLYYYSLRQQTAEVNHFPADVWRLFKVTGTFRHLLKRTPLNHRLHFITTSFLACIQHSISMMYTRISTRGSKVEIFLLNQ